MAFSSLRRCPHCGLTNRVPAKHLADTGRCGSCKQELSPSATPIDVDGPEFDEIVSEARVPVLVDFWADWCGPCKMATPEVAAVAQEMSGRALVLKVDTERNQDLMARFGIGGIPYFLVFRNGRPAAQQMGAASRGQLKQLLMG